MTSKGRRRHGTGCPNAKLTDGDIIDIRTLIAAGATRPALAEAFGVTAKTIRRVVTGVSWKHLP